MLGDQYRKSGFPRTMSGVARPKSGTRLSKLLPILSPITNSEPSVTTVDWNMEYSNGSCVFKIGVPHGPGGLNGFPFTRIEPLGPGPTVSPGTAMTLSTKSPSEEGCFNRINSPR